MSNDDTKDVHEFTPMIEALLQLYAPSDVEKAFLIFGATCGPCAFAAFLRKEVLEVRHYFPSFPERQYTNLPMMTKALASAGIRWEKVNQWPNQGLVLISGPEKYHSRHWVATTGEFVYEVSLDTWLPKKLWERDYLPELAKRHQSKASDWRVEAGLELSAFSQLDLPMLCR